MKRAFALILALTMTFALAACGGGTSSTAGGGGASTAAGGGASTGGDPNRELVAAIPGLPDTLDSQGTSSLYTRLGANFQTYDTLLMKNSNKEIVPNMAESFEVSDDASEITFKLHEGIKWWDGTELKASDVKFTVERAQAASGAQSNAVADVDSVEVIDDYNFKFVMKNPNVAVLEYLTYFFILQEAFTTEQGDNYGLDVGNIMGCGPYKPTKMVPGESIHYEAFADYWAGAPAIKSVMLKVITDVNAAVIALQTGEIDLYMNEVPFISMGTVQNDATLAVDFFPSNRYNFLVFNTEDPMFQDVRMREAVAYAVNRDEMLIVAVEDTANGTLANGPGGQDFVGNPGNDRIQWPYEYDPEKGAQLVKDAGFEGASLTIKTLNVEPYVKIATKLQDYLSKIGLVADIQQLENTPYIEDVCDKGNYTLAVCFNAFAGKDMDICLGASMSSRYGLSGNYARYKDEHLDELIMAGKTATNPEERKDVYATALEYWYECLQNVPLYFANSTRAYTTDLAIEDGMSQYDHFYYYAWK